MQPSQIRRRILEDHEVIRGILLSVEHLSHEVSEGKVRHVGPLRLEGEALLLRLNEHMGWEDRHLRPVLLDTPGWGEERAKRLDRDHREQRELLEYSLGAVQDQSRPPLVLARQLIELVKLLREDMADEENLLVNERVLRDDVVAIDAEAG
jgi:hypothetical protein